LFASIALHALRGDGLSIQELVISLFLFITAPVSAYMVAKAALQRRTTFFDNTINTEMSKDILERRAPKD
ncbi:MAG: monovalent cation/H(+) antiporter subunit G, partial [Pseudomonadales bacterium]|nr:monovalent cation/H(+) antiporter subunit G [Pseudomonadales bacterium]